MAFKFSLEQVLKYRTQLEEEAKVSFAQMENERKREEERQKQLIQSLVHEQTRLSNIGLNIDERFYIENFIKGLRQDIVESQKYLRHWEAKVEEARAILTEKARDKKILEKLKEKKEVQYVHEEKINEQKFFDEITAGKTARYN